MTQVSENRYETFDVRVVLTVTTGLLLVSGDGLSDFHKLLDHLCGDTLFTHQLGRAAEECAPQLIERFPGLGEFDSEGLEAMLEGFEEIDERRKVVDLWVRREILRLWLADKYHIAPLENPPEHRSPIAELIEMRGSADGIITIVADGEQE